MQSTGRPRRVFVTGRGVMVGGRADIGSLWAAVRSGTRLDEVRTDDEVLRAASKVSAPDLKVCSRHQLEALSVVEQAWAEAGLDERRNRLRGERSDVRRPRFGCVSGTSLGGLLAMQKEMSGDRDRFSPYSVTRWRANALSCAVSLRFGLGGCDFSLNAASATGAQVAYLAASMVHIGAADAMVAVAAESACEGRLNDAMHATGSVAPPDAGGPLTSTRGGMRPVEGAACVLFESEEHCTARGGRPLAEWLAGETANESHHILAPDPEGTTMEELLRGVRGRLERPVDWVSLHSTGTARFDPTEIACVRRSFASGLPWLSAFKRTTGHALGAAGLLDVALLSEGLRAGEVPCWPTGTDPELGIADPPGPPPAPRCALQLAQGMGGVVVVQAFASTRETTPHAGRADAR